MALVIYKGHEVYSRAIMQFFSNKVSFHATCPLFCIVGWLCATVAQKLEDVHICLRKMVFLECLCFARRFIAHSFPDWSTQYSFRIFTISYCVCTLFPRALGHQQTQSWLQYHTNCLDIRRFQITFLEQMPRSHYRDVIMSTMAYRITSLTTLYSTVYSGADQRKHQSSASLTFVSGIQRWPVNSPQKGPATRKIFPFDDVIMVVWGGGGGGGGGDCATAAQ